MAKQARSDSQVQPPDRPDAGPDIPGQVVVVFQGGGALGANGAVIGIETSLPAALAPFILPVSPTGAELRSAIRASLAVLDLALDRVTVPTLGAVWRSILGAADFSWGRRHRGGNPNSDQAPP